MSEFGKIENIFDNVIQVFNDSTYNKFLNEIQGFKISDSYPYNLSYEEDQKLLILEIACAGFTKDEIDVEVIDNTKLRIKIETGKEDSSSKKYQHKGIAQRSFNRVLTVVNSYDLKGTKVKYENGLLRITVPKKADASYKVDID